MSTIFPGSASVGQIFDGYEFNGTAWDIIGIDLTADYQPKITGVSDTEIEYLNGVNSPIQTQINTKAPTANPTFTGTVAGITKSMIGLGNVDNTSDVGKPVSSATQTALDAKATIGHSHDFAATGHGHSYLSTAGGSVTGTISITNGGLSVTPSGANITGGIYSSGNIYSTTTIEANSHIRNLWVEMFDSGGIGYSRPMDDNDTQSGSSTRRWTRVFAVNTTISSSDERDKLEINDSPLGLEFINDLRPVSYRWKIGERKAIIDQEGNPILDSDGNKTYEIREGVRKHYGLISQEVKQALDNSGVDDFAGWVQDDLSDPDSHQSISYEQFIAPLIKSVQELSAEVQTLKDKVAELEAK
jgi:hypothetical protein